jgi:hypothetical protein
MRACRGDPWRGRSEFCQCLRRSSSHTNLASTTGPSLSRTWMDIKANGWLLLLLRTISASERAASTWAASKLHPFFIGYELIAVADVKKVPWHYARNS